MNLVRLFLISTVFSMSVSVQAVLRVSTYNIRNFDSKGPTTNKAELKKILMELKFDLLGSQEIVNTNSFNKFLRTEFKQYSSITSRCGGGGRQKLAIVYKKSKLQLVKSYEDMRFSDPGTIVTELGCGPLRPALVAVFKDLKTKERFVAINFHLKAGVGTRSYQKRWAQYKLVAKLVKELSRADYKNIILLGDFNTTGYINRNDDYATFTKILDQMKYRTVSSEIACTSYWSGKNRRDGVEVSSVLDHILYPQGFLGYSKMRTSVHAHCAKVLCSDATPSSLGVSYKQVSDHCPVSTVFLK